MARDPRLFLGLRTDLAELRHDRSRPFHQRSHARGPSRVPHRRAYILAYPVGSARRGESESGLRSAAKRREKAAAASTPPAIGVVVFCSHGQRRRYRDGYWYSCDARPSRRRLQNCRSICVQRMMRWSPDSSCPGANLHAREGDPTRRERCSSRRRKTSPG